MTSTDLVNRVMEFICPCRLCPLVSVFGAKGGIGDEKKRLI